MIWMYEGSLQCRRILGGRNLACVRRGSPIGFFYPVIPRVTFGIPPPIGIVEIVTLTVGARAKEGKGERGKGGKGGGGGEG